LTFLGHIIGRDGIKTDPKKIERMVNLKEPTNKKELRSALGLFSYYQKFIKNFAQITRPLFDFVKDVSYEWTEDQQKAFDYLKSAMVRAPILIHPDFNKPFILYTDASGIGVGAILAQKDDEGKEHVIEYASRLMNDAEKNYPITE
jgi:hypothetical protein